MAGHLFGCSGGVLLLSLSERRSLAGRHIEVGGVVVVVVAADAVGDVITLLLLLLLLLITATAGGRFGAAELWTSSALLP